MQAKMGRALPEEGRRRIAGYSLVAIAALSWATGGILARWLFEADRGIGAMELAAGRAVTAALLLLLIVGVFKPARLRTGLRELPFFVVFGVVGLALLHYTYFEAIARAGVARAILLEYMAPILVLLYSVVFLGDRPTWRLPAAVGLSVAGCSLVVGAFGTAEGTSVDGIAWGLVSAVLFAGYMLMGRWAASRYSPWTVLTYGLAAAALFWLVVLGPRVALSSLGTPRDAIAVGWIAVVATIVPFGLFLAALRSIGPTEAGITSTLEPVIAAIAGLLLFGEPLGVVQFGGAALVVAAVVLVQLPERREKELPPAV